MTVGATISISDGNLVVHGKTILTGVPDNIVLTHGTGVGLAAGAFIGATASDRKSVHVFPMGTLQGLRFTCLFRFKLWWMTQRMGNSGRDVPLETQFMLVESKDGTAEAELGAAGGEEGSAATIYTVFLPLLEGQFRAALQGNERDQIEICLESGDEAVETNQAPYMVFMHSGTNPFEVINQAVKVVEMHMGTFHHREKKKMPSFVNWFGWCTWDAFYTDVTAEGVREGLKSLSEGGAPPRFVIIDDGWQQISSVTEDRSGAVFQEGSQFGSRLTGIKENAKFQNKKVEGENDPSSSSGLKLVVDEAKQHHNVKYVYVWHAIAGYWGGVKPAGEGVEHYESTLTYPVTTPGVMGNQVDHVLNGLTAHGLGLVHPKKVYSFYSELHAYLASCGVDGVKVDSQNIIETLGAGHGGRVSLARAYHRALEASVNRYFPDNGCISCMCHNTDMLYSAKQTAVARASDDFFPRDPASHTIHIASVAYNTLFLGEFMQPDWDMFHSLHPAAEYHGAARAVGGCPVYVSDEPGRHSFELLRKLVLPDGSVLRAQLPGRPTRDSLFNDPARDGASLLKIWNVNKCTGVVGVFNCQGAGWCKIAKDTRVHDAAPGTLTGTVSARDVDTIAQLAGEAWGGEAVAYAFKSGELVRLPNGAALPVTLKVLEYELFHICPIKVVVMGVSFAPIGLLDMFNSGGAVEQLDVRTSSAGSAEDRDGGEGFSDPAEKLSENRAASAAAVVVRVRGCGRFGAYSSQRPVKCTLDSSGVEFIYDSATGLVTLNIPVPKEEMYRWTLEIQV